MATRQQLDKKLKSLNGSMDKDRHPGHETIYLHAPDGHLWRASGTHSICQDATYRDPRQRAEVYDWFLDDLQHGVIPGPCDDSDCELCNPE